MKILENGVEQQNSMEDLMAQIHYEVWRRSQGSCLLDVRKALGNLWGLVGIFHNSNSSCLRCDMCYCVQVGLSPTIKL